jgi:hypothetical protein
MPKRPQTAAPLALKCALLFLAVSVFAFGLNAKLSLYQKHQSPDTVAAAKLSTEKRAAQSTIVLKVVKEPLASDETLRLMAFAVFHNVISSPTFRLHQVEVSLCSPCRCDSRSSSLMNRPPPTLS